MVSIFEHLGVRATRSVAPIVLWQLSGSCSDGVTVDPEVQHSDEVDMADASANEEEEAGEETELEDEEYEQEGVDDEDSDDVPSLDVTSEHQRNYAHAGTNTGADTVTNANQQAVEIASHTSATLATSSNGEESDREPISALEVEEMDAELASLASQLSEQHRLLEESHQRAVNIGQECGRIVAEQMRLIERRARLVGRWSGA
jgi:hypothetical protein